MSCVSPEPISLDFSVAICTYNGAQRLPAVLNCLRRQIQVDDLAWEVIVIDNNSTDDTAQGVEAFRENWPETVALRYAVERQQGLGFARHRAVALAQSPWVGFLDDDNLPSLDWVAQAYQFGQAHPQAGAYGSRLRGVFEVEPPPNFERIAPYLALTDRGSQPLLYRPSQKILPPGAGLVVRRQAWAEQVPTVQVLTGRLGKSLVGGEDLEAVLYIQQAGWEVWYNPAMQVDHLIPKSRLERTYLIRLLQAVGLSRYRTRMLSFPAWTGPLVMPLYALNDLRKIVRQLLKYGGATFTDTVAASELSLYCYSLVSPLYFWRQGLQQRLASRKYPGG
ncbi:MAG: glycosyltransferase family 2 protein [Cyanobacteria bacterium Co-bin13]|nr:glycosyltransferase family 2 protein [Cyanobacteria bacterium Co-bin13]